MLTLQCHKAMFRIMYFIYYNQLYFIIILKFVIVRHVYILILCRLEYGWQLWNPHLKKDILLLENIQRGFTQHIAKVSHLSYSERLTALNLYSLQRRRERLKV